MKKLPARFLILPALFAALLLCGGAHRAQAAEYSLDVARQTVNVTGHPVKKITVNGTIPAHVRYEQKFGETSSIAKSNGEENDDFIAAPGLRLMF